MSEKMNVNLSRIKKLLERVEGQEAHVELGELEDRLIKTGFVDFGPRDFRNIEIVNGLLSWEGAQISLYIYQPHNSYEQLKALRNPEDSPRFHLTDCQKLQEMRADGRFDRYVAHRMPSESFPIRYKLVPRQEWSDEEIFVDLWACKYCMSSLGLRRDDSFVRNFDRVAFFEKHKSYFHYPPKYTRSTYPAGGYPPDWRYRATKLKDKNDWCCDCCNIDLSAQEHQRLLHAHHINGILQDCSEKNLRSLCSLCHSKQPLHGRITTEEDEERLRKIRERQGRSRFCPKCRS